MFQQFMKQNKANTKYKHDFYLAFAFIANKLDPLEKPFYKLGLRVSSGFLNPKTSNTIKALGPPPRSFISLLMFRNPGETVAFVYEA